MNRDKTLKMLRDLTPEKILFSPGGRLKIALLKLGAPFLPGRFAVWLSLLDDTRLERQVRVNLGPRAWIPGSRAYAVPRLHLIVERSDWLALQVDALQTLHHSPGSSPPQKNVKSGLATIQAMCDASGFDQLRERIHSALEFDPVRNQP